MICKFCGMESATTDRCSFCGQSLADAQTAPPPAQTVSGVETASSAPATVLTGDTGAPAKRDATPSAAAKSAGARKPAPAFMAPASERVRRVPAATQPGAQWMPPPSASHVDSTRPTAATAGSAASGPQPPHVSLSDPLAEHALYMQNAAQSPQTPTATPVSASAAMSQAAAPSAPTASVSPPPPAPTTAKPDAAAPAASTPGNARSGRNTKRDKNRDIRPDFHAPIVSPALLGRYSGAFAIVLIVAAALAYVGPQFSAVPLALAQFVGAMLLPVMRLVPWQDEDSDDVLFFILFTLMFGPAVALVIYGIIGAVRQTVNPALVGCMVVAVLSRVVVDLAARTYPPAQVLSQTMPFTHLAQIDANLVKMLLKDWSGMIALAGWYMANVFHKLDE